MTGVNSNFVPAENTGKTELDYTEQTSWMLFLKYLDDLKQSLLQKAFSGELTAEKKSPQKRLKGTTIEYEAPTEPVGAEDWGAMRR